jgi:hypothetical protein
MKSINKQIRKLFDELDKVDSEKDFEEYWDVKLRLFQLITKKYGIAEYSPKTCKMLNVPAALVSTIVKMERERLPVMKRIADFLFPKADAFDKTIMGSLALIAVSAIGLAIYVTFFR